MASYSKVRTERIRAYLHDDFSENPGSAIFEGGGPIAGACFRFAPDAEKKPMRDILLDRTIRVSKAYEVPGAFAIWLTI
jgi:hypothetical protein